MSASSNSSGRVHARQLVKSIAEQHGFLDEDSLGRLEPNMRRVVEEALFKKDEMIGSSVITLAKNLYDSSARFVFELLQNADDNSYSRAKASSADPYVSFHVYDQQIVVECNEDGFTEENLEAICNVGKSSKSGAQGYIGEKGIGFKSVFMVAWKALIQSGDFSFFFQHRKGDSGMGMISPVWQEQEQKQEQAVPDHLTRITLSLRDSIRDNAMGTTLSQFREIEATFLLFMKNLKRINIAMYDESGHQTRLTTYSIECYTDNRVDLITAVQENGESKLDIKHFHVIKRIARDLPPSENRNYSDEISQAASKKAEVVLAFPLSSDNIPIIESQQVFAFLPIRTMGFSFLIQTDFVTNASRQDIVRSSPRNKALLNKIAKAFVKAVLQFCEHRTLRYQWMRYLPQETDYPWDEFWQELVAEIRWSLRDVSMLWTPSLQTLHPTHALRRLAPEMLDCRGNPLLPDSNPEQYVASGYLPTDLDKLQYYGLVYMSKSEFLKKKIRPDLDKDRYSVIKSSERDEEWHSRLALFLVSCFVGYPNTIKKLPLVPLIAGRWMSTRDTSIYYSHVNQYPIPTDLGLHMVDPQAEKTPERKTLYDLLGVLNPDAPSIRELIFDKYNDVSFIGDLATSRSHLAFLYLTTHLDKENDAQFYRDSFKHVHVFDEDIEFWEPHSDTVYFTDDNPYGAGELFQPYYEAPGLHATFIHHDYLDNPPDQPESEDLSWKTWLRDRLCIANIIPIYESDSKRSRLSKECLYVAEHRPERFIGYLLENWKGNNARICQIPQVTTELLQLEVTCTSGRKHPLGETYLPIAEYERRVQPFLMNDEFFPWLHIETRLLRNAKISALKGWAKELGFGDPKSDLEFYLTILRFLHLANSDTSGLENEARIYDLYGRIATRYHESITRDISRQQIREAFELPLIYVPKHTGTLEATWAQSKQCLWAAPANMETKYSLQSCYEDIKGSEHFTRLFYEILNIPDAGVKDILDELMELSNYACSDFDHICNIYKALERRSSGLSSSDALAVRGIIEDQCLIYIVDAGWYAISQCIWSTTTEIKGKITLNDQYEDMRDFFVGFLGVDTLTLKMVVDNLAEKGREHSSVQEIKSTIWSLNALLQTEEEHPNPNKILETRVFPIRYPDGRVKLHSSKMAFSIADREHLSDLFSNKSKTLHFNVNEVLLLEPFFEWSGLENRYLSLSVKEISGLKGGSSRRLKSPERDLARKAHGLLRIALHCKSPRVQKDEQLFYENLKKIEVYETDGVSSQLHLSQDGKDIVVEQGTSELHFQEHNDRLRIYIPRDEELQDLCFLDRVPTVLFKWIMTDPVTGICEGINNKVMPVVQKVLQAKNKQVALILTRAGIISIQTPDDSINDQPSDSADIDPLHAEESSTSTRFRSDNDWDRETLVQDTEHEDASDVEDSIYATAAATHSSSRSRNPMPFTPRRGTSGSHRPIFYSNVQPAETVDSEYLGILLSVVACARRAAFPSRGTFDMAALAHSLNPVSSDAPSEYFGLRSSEKVERDKKIGAAGELFVFEILSQLVPSLPGFSRNNWRSTIRHYVSIHENYTDLIPWLGRETADITYHDRGGILTNFLVDKGYLNASQWSGKRPRYFLEVKSTTGPCEKEFYMSKYQYARMQRTSNGPSGSAQMESVYIILRVFNLGKDSIEMKVYVDPETMRQRNELHFTADTWSVSSAPSRN